MSENGPTLRARGGEETGSRFTLLRASCAAAGQGFNLQLVSWPGWFGAIRPFHGLLPPVWRTHRRRRGTNACCWRAWIVLAYGRTQPHVARVQFCGNCGAASGTPTAPAAGVAAAAVGVAVPSGGVETIPTAVPYSVGANTSRRDPWEKFSWASLPQEYKNNWITLGYDQRSWDGVAPLPKALNCTFAQLSPDQQRAAGFLGYARNMWDNDSKMSECSLKMPRIPF